jgi:hypothetical protein
VIWSTIAFNALPSVHRRLRFLRQAGFGGAGGEFLEEVDSS